jgi:hypothetical protein
MAVGEQINVRPHFETTKLPCEADVGDLLVLTPLKEGDVDPSPQGLASLWFCIKANVGGQRPAVWARVQFDGIASCDIIVPDPPQAHPPIHGG